MEKLKPVTWLEFVSRMKELGFEGPFTVENIQKMKRGNQTIIIPNKHESEIGIGFLTRLLKQAGISKVEWLNKYL